MGHNRDYGDIRIIRNLIPSREVPRGGAAPRPSSGLEMRADQPLGFGDFGEHLAALGDAVIA